MQTSPRKQIAAVDRKIDGIKLEIYRRGLRPISAAEWQIAWDRNPDLRTKNHDLYSQRGQLQVLRDAADHKAYVSTQRRERKAAKTRYSNCPTCGSRTLQVAA